MFYSALVDEDFFTLNDQELQVFNEKIFDQDEMPKLSSEDSDNDDDEIPMEWEN